MGQKINPKGFRIGTFYTWESRWFADSGRYKEFLLEDIAIRGALHAKLKTAGLSQVELERSINKLKVILHVSKPGVVIGRGGSGLEDLKKYIQTYLFNHRKTRFATKKITKEMMEHNNKMKVELSVEPVKEPNLNAFLIATHISDQLARRMPQRRVCNQAIERIMSSGAKGVKIALAGRIAGAEIARREKYKMGTIPLSTMRESIDYASVPSLTKSGYIGIKVWICK